jgi:HPt (histidine-containing phosphotransfer) domain-containing protein
MSQFTQRHYKTIATVMNKAIRISHEEKLIGSKATALLIQKLITTFEQDNPKFKKELFMKALADGTSTVRQHPVINQLNKLHTENVTT